MTKVIAFCLLTVLLFSCCGVPGLADEVPGTVEMPYAGLRFTPPEEYRGTHGQIVTDGAMELLPGVQYAYWIYCAVTEDELDALRGDPNITDVAGVLFYVFSIGNGMDFDDMNRILGGTLSAGAAREIGKAGAYTFYLYMEGPDMDLAFGIDEPYAEEYIALAGLTGPVAAAFTCFEPMDRYTALIGSTVDFTTTDLEGNAVSSLELFAENEITLLNVWATWCGPCIGELEELGRIHLRLQEKGCGVAGLLVDRDLDAARRLVRDKGAAYPILLAPANLDALFALEGYPTTFFIGRDGKVLAAPIVGAYVSAYESTLEALLETKE